MDELFAELKEMLAENLEVLNSMKKEKQSEYADGYQAGYENAVSHMMNILEGKFGSVKNPAVLLGQRGGKSTSDAKTAASRENGKKGGRPRKNAL